MKVRVPKELRPPIPRHGTIEFRGAQFKVKGVFRAPKPGEPYWGCFGGVVFGGAFDLNPRVILEKVA